MAAVALPGINVGAVVGGFNSLTRAIQDSRKLLIAEKELDENLRLGKARRDILGLESEEKRTELNFLSKMMKSSNPDEKNIAVEMLSGSASSRIQRQQIFLSQQENQMLRTNMAMNKEQRAQQDQIRQQNKNQVDALYSAKIDPSTALSLGRDTEITLAAIAAGKFNPEVHRTLADIGIDFRQAVSDERDRDLKEIEAREQRAEARDISGEERRTETRAGEFQLKASIDAFKNMSDTEQQTYEWGSLLEIREALTRGFMPETRLVMVDPEGIGLFENRDATGIVTPTAFQKKKMRYMTERRAGLLGLKKEWDNANIGSTLADERVKALIER